MRCSPGRGILLAVRSVIAVVSAVLSLAALPAEAHATDCAQRWSARGYVVTSMSVRKFTCYRARTLVRAYYASGGLPKGMRWEAALPRPWVGGMLTIDGYEARPDSRRVRWLGHAKAGANPSIDPPRIPSSTREAKDCGRALNNARQASNVYITKGRGGFSCRHARAVVHAAQFRSLHGWTWFNWYSPFSWEEAWERDDGRVVVATYYQYEPD